MRVGMIVLFAMLYVGLGLFLYLGKKTKQSLIKNRNHRLDCSFDYYHLYCHNLCLESGGYMFSKENYKMIATDLDGTLLDKESKISTYTLEVLKKLKEKGYYLTIATGRSLESVKSVIPDLSLFDYILLNNGAFCISHKQEKANTLE